MRKYSTEKEGQIDFFKNYKIPYEEDSRKCKENRKLQ